VRRLGIQGSLPTEVSVPIRRMDHTRKDEFSLGSRKRVCERVRQAAGQDGGWAGRCACRARSRRRRRSRLRRWSTRGAVTALGSSVASGRSACTYLRHRCGRGADRWSMELLPEPTRAQQRADASPWLVPGPDAAQTSGIVVTTASVTRPISGAGCARCRPPGCPVHRAGRSRRVLAPRRCPGRAPRDRCGPVRPPRRGGRRAGRTDRAWC
jgi:hypothetical protein